jgi:hypothetical protein
MKKDKPKNKRNLITKDLNTPKYKLRIIRNGKLYSRKKRIRDV